MKRILVVVPVNEKQKACLESHAAGCCFTYASYNTVTREQAQEANIVFGNVPAAYLTGSHNLELLQLNSAGADHYIQSGVLPEQTILTNATGAYGLALSEHMLGMLLEIQKKLYLYRDNQNRRCWRDEGPVTSIYGSTTLIVGLGDIGSEFAKRMKALGSRIIGVKRTMSTKPEYADELYTLEKLDELLPLANIIALCLPGTKETFHLINRRRLLSMKPDAILLNIGRGTAIDTMALTEVLKSGHLAGAAVDVTEPEPLPPDHPLWEIKNAVITPHISGYFHLSETLERIVQIAAANIDAYLNGRPLKNVVDFQTGYRKPN